MSRRGRINGSASRSATLTASRRDSRWPSGSDHVEVIDEQAAALQAGGLGHRHPGDVVHHREVGVAAAEALDGLARLELQHLDDELGVHPAQVTHRRRHEGGQGAGESGHA